ncbi:MAG: exodeoxyribonuclease VII large subunit, partial [Nitrospinae bacterium]|nr:exodeoxyribonuclease VII large subunit [Nitrospinota bacterium]
MEGNLFDQEKVFGVSEISGVIKSLLEEAFPSIWVEGEVGKAMDHSSGHLYLTLKENKDVLDATMWRGSRKNLKFEIETGMKILVRGRVSSYGPYGKYQLIAERIEPSGMGALQIKFEQLKKKLSAKGYFDEARKRPLPAFPETIGVVTSESGAAFRDIVRILRRRCPGIRIILAPVLVEGDLAKTQIARAIEDLNRHGEADLIIAGRGGGSPESLWAFNEEVVADAIFNSKIPVISAVGHEIDFTIADFTAD